MAFSAGAVVGEITLRYDGAVSALKAVEQQTQRTLQRVGDRMGKLGESFTRTGMQLSRSVTLPLIAIGAAGLKAGTDMESAMAAIRRGTGATGADLRAMGEDFRTVFAGVPQSAEDVSTAIADLHTRLGLTGEPLQQMSRQMLDLARVSRVDVATVVRTSTRLFGDWSIATETQSAALDHLWRVSQSTGIGVDRLSEQMVTYGAQFRAFGMSFDEVSAMLGVFEKEGVATEKMLGALSMGLGSLVQAGEEPREALQSLLRALETGRTETELMADVIDMFGKRAGPDLALAIQEGRFEIDAFMAALAQSPETIAAAAAETMTFSDRLATLRNQTILALEPLGLELIKAVELLQPLFGRMIATLTQAGQAFGNLPQPVKTIAIALAAMAAAAGPVLIVLGQLAFAIKALMPVGIAIAGAGGPILLIVGALAVLGVAIWQIIKHWDAIKGATAATWQAIVGVVGPATEGMRGTLAEWGQEIGAIATEAWGAVREVTARFWEWVGPFVMGYVDLLVGNLRAAWELSKAATQAAWEAIRLIVGTAWDAIKLIIGTALTLIASILRAGLAVLRGDWQGAWQAIRDMFRAVWENILTFLRSVVGRFVEAGTNIMKALTDGIKNAAMAPVDAVRSALQRIRNMLPSSDPLEGPLQGLTAMGTNIMKALTDGIKNAAMAPVDAVRSALQRIRNMLPSSDPLEGPLQGLTAMGMAIPLTLAAGVLLAAPALVQAVEDVLGRTKEETDDTTDEMGGFWQHTVDRIQDAWADGIYNILTQTGSLRDLLGGIWKTILRAFAEMVAQMIAKWIILKTTMAMGGGPLGFVARIIGLHEGGVVTRPTIAMVGEAGPEAVIPLSQMAQAPALAGAGIGGGEVHFHEGAIQLSAAGMTEYDLHRLRDRLMGPIGQSLTAGRHGRPI